VTALVLTSLIHSIVRDGLRPVTGGHEKVVVKQEQGNFIYEEALFLLQVLTVIMTFT
jgi:hypothetical protein